MYIETEYIYNQFVNNFIEAKTSPIIIYGTGLNTQKLLERVDNERIIGLMDEKKTGQVLWGYKVLSYEEVAAVNDAIIVIIARNAVIHVIYRRIEEFCHKNDIQVYDIHGKNLSQRQEGQEEYPCFQLKEEDLRMMITEHDIISFDMFDTLLMRRIMRPRDVFSVMDLELCNKNYIFSKERIKSEDSFEKGHNPNIYEIYERFAENVGIDEKERKELIDLELSTEKRFLVKRTKICEIFDWAVQQGKEVYIVSDMYFPKEILESILKSFGVNGYKDIFVSCDYKAMKQEGLLAKYKSIVSESEIFNGIEKFLHIGDNYFSDIVAAQYAGIDTYQIYSAQEMFECSIYAKSLQQCKTLEENIILASFAERAFNNPFRACEMNGKLILNNTEDVIGLFIAPIIYKYAIWLVQGLEKEQCDLVLFPSRDGYLIQKIYEKIKIKNPRLKLPDSLYMYTSRRAAMVAAVEREEDVQAITNFIFVQGKAELLKERFGIDVDDGQDVSNSTLLTKCEGERERYKEYLEQIGLYKYNRIAFMDFVAMGTVQAAMEQVTKKALIGFYFLRRLADRKKLEDLKCHSLYKAAGDFQIEANVYRYYYFLETIITSYEPTFWGINEHGQKEFYEEKRDRETIELLKRIHAEILRYCELLLNLLPDVGVVNSEIDIYDSLLGYFSADCSIIENEEINKLVNIDEFMGKVVTDINR